MRLLKNKIPIRPNWLQGFKIGFLLFTSITSVTLLMTSIPAVGGQSGVIALDSSHSLRKVIGHIGLTTIVLVASYIFTIRLWPDFRASARDLGLVALALIGSFMLVRVYSVLGSSLSLSFPSGRLHRLSLRHSTCCGELTASSHPRCCKRVSLCHDFWSLDELSATGGMGIYSFDNGRECNCGGKCKDVL